MPGENARQLQCDRGRGNSWNTHLCTFTYGMYLLAELTNRHTSMIVFIAFGWRCPFQSSLFAKFHFLWRLLDPRQRQSASCRFFVIKNKNSWEVTWFKTNHILPKNHCDWCGSGKPKIWEVKAQSLGVIITHVPPKVDAPCVPLTGAALVISSAICAVAVYIL